MPAYLLRFHSSGDILQNWGAALFGGLATAVIAGCVFSPAAVSLLGLVLMIFAAALDSTLLLLPLAFLLPLDIGLSSSAPIRNVGMALNAIIAVLVLFWRGFLHGDPIWNRVRHPITTASLGFLAAVVVSIVLGDSADVHAGLRGAGFIGGYLLCYFAFLGWLDRPQRTRQVLGCLFASSIVVSVFAVVQKAAGGFTPLWHALHHDTTQDITGIEALGRVSSFLGHPNHLAGYLDLLVPCALGCALLAQSRFWKILSGTAAFFGVVALFLTQSRGGYLGCAVALILAILHFSRTHIQRLLITTSFGLSLGGVYALLQWWNPAHFDEIGTDTSLLIRVLLWGNAWDLFLGSPFHGIGYGTFALISEQFLPKTLGTYSGLGAHNLFLSLLAETGLLGLLAFLVLIAIILREAYRQLRSSDWCQHAVAFGVMAGTVGILVAGVFDHYFLSASEIGYVFWLLLAVLVANGRCFQTIGPLGSAR